MENKKKGNKLKYIISVIISILLLIAIGSTFIIAEDTIPAGALGNSGSYYHLKENDEFSLWSGKYSADSWHEAVKESKYSFNCLNENVASMYTGRYSTFTGWVKSNDQILGYIRSDVTPKEDWNVSNAFTGQSQQQGLWYYIGKNNNQLEGISGKGYTIYGSASNNSKGKSIYEKGLVYSKAIDGLKQFNNSNINVTRNGKNVTVTVHGYFAKLEVECNGDVKTVVGGNYDNNGLITNLKYHDQDNVKTTFTLNNENDEINVKAKAYAIEFTTFMRGMKPNQRWLPDSTSMVYSWQNHIKRGYI